MRHTPLYTITALALMLAACGERNADTTPEPATAEDSTTTEDSRTDLGLSGTYSGTVPCADCEGIATQLTINEDGTYVLRTQYVGKSDKLFVAEGVFERNEDSSMIVLRDLEGGARYYQVGEGLLAQRDMQGNPMKSELVDRYVLRKEIASGPGHTGTSSTLPPLEGTYWKLVELMGKSIPEKDGRIGAHMLLHHEDKRVAGNAGCNSFFAVYEWDRSSGRLRFNKAGSTMMACQDMSMEELFLDALGQVDSYSISEDGMLTLKVTKMPPLMRFEAVEM